MVQICLIGHYPPPYGGESVEIEGIRNHLVDSSVDCRVIDIGESRSKPRQECVQVTSYADFVRKTIQSARQGYLIHLITNGHNTKSWLTAGVISLAGLFNGRRNLLTLGSGDMPGFLGGLGWIRRLWVRRILAGFRLVIIRNEKAQKAIKDIGGKPEKLRIVAPYTGSMKTTPELVPDNVKDFLENHSPVIVSAVAYRPEYGIDRMFQAVKQLADDFPGLGLGLILLGTTTGQDEAAAEAAKRGLADRVCFAGGLVRSAYLWVVENSTVFLRATSYDGDASSVREALALKVPVIASRTDFRPEGTVTFPVTDSKAMMDILRQALREPRKFIPEEAPADPARLRLEKILEVYREVLLSSGEAASDLPEVFNS